MLANTVKAVLQYMMMQFYVQCQKCQCHFYYYVVNNQKLLDVCRTKTKHHKKNDKKNDEY